MRSDRHVGPMRSTASVDAYVNAFRSDLNNDVEGMWLDHDICVVKISGAKYSHCNFVDLLGNYVIIETIESYAVEVGHKQAAARLQGFLAEWDEIQVVTITRFDPARTGWGLAQNRKIRKHAVALSILVPYLLDKRGNTCENEFVSSFCTVAAAKRPPAA